MDTHRWTPTCRLLAIVAVAALAFGSATARETAARADGEGGTDGETHPRIAIELESGGRIVVELLPEEAPCTCERILALVREGFYDGCSFHRVESYLVQAGKKECELPPIEGEMFGQTVWHDPGAVGIARLPDDYDSAIAQFYIMKEKRSTFNGEYTLFGHVVEGMDAVTEIEKGAKIEHVSLLE
ncbi:MAG: peptidylprolyl isomerase [Candidatus Krumholzibacteriota bacterium]|nr:peptidylprolyl isomerase [Candidatus Krumholzibacteriota bacterium]